MDVKDAQRPKKEGEWGEEAHLGQGEVNPRRSSSSEKDGYQGPLTIERGAKPSSPGCTKSRLAWTISESALGANGRESKVAEVTGPVRKQEKQLFFVQVYWLIKLRARTDELNSQRYQRRVQALARPRSRRKNCACLTSAAQSDGRAVKVPDDD